MPDATLAASYPAYGIAHVGRIAFTPHPPVRRGAIPDAMLAASYPAYGSCRADKAFTPHPPVARCNAGCDACHV
ncbi:hypothetical protein ACLK1T_21405 [Escherichia coli]